jgi:hypothetical protein
MDFFRSELKEHLGWTLDDARAFVVDTLPFPKRRMKDGVKQQWLKYCHVVKESMEEDEEVVHSFVSDFLMRLYANWLANDTHGLSMLLEPIIITTSHSPDVVRTKSVSAIYIWDGKSDTIRNKHSYRSKEWTAKPLKIFPVPAEFLSWHMIGAVVCNGAAIRNNYAGQVDHDQYMAFEPFPKTNKHGYPMPYTCVKVPWQVYKACLPQDEIDTFIAEKNPEAKYRVRKSDQARFYEYPTPLLHVLKQKQTRKRKRQPDNETAKKKDKKKKKKKTDTDI